MNFIMLVLFGSIAHAGSISESQYWHRLLHYKKTLTGGYQSDARGDFYFAPDGDKNPEAELKADVEAFSKNIEFGPLKQHPQCAFPARYAFLKKELDLKTADVPCKDYREWRDKIGGTSVTLVFSSYFAGEPGSMFGHTFLRINNERSIYSERGQKKLDILDYVANFSATTPEKVNPIAYAMSGLFGFYPGRYSVWPYYIKVKEYNNAEGRDLYEYDLDISGQEMERLLSHLWELGNGYFDYYFLKKNCSYQLLTLLEVAKPEWDLSSRFLTHAIPVDTVKVLEAYKGAIKAVKFRPSLKKILDKHWAKLNASERKHFFEITRANKDPSQIESVELADALVTYYNFRQMAAKGELSADETKWYRRILIKRATFPVSQENVELADHGIEPSRPDLGHHSMRAGVGGGMRGNQGFQEIAWKASLHDLLDSDVGYTPYSQLDVFNLALRYYSGANKLAVDRLDLITLTALSPYHPLETKFSYHFDVGASSVADSTCLNCLAAKMDLGGGYAVSPWGKRSIFYGMGIARFDGSIIRSGIEKGWRIGGGFNVAAILNPVDAYKIHLSSKWLYFPGRVMNSFAQFQLEQGLSLSRSWDIRLALSRVQATTSVGANINSAALNAYYYY